MNARVGTTSTLARVGGAAALFSGVALLVHILFGASLLLSLIATAFCGAMAMLWLWRDSPPFVREALLHRAGSGAIAGLIATGAYDVTRFLLSRGESFPYDPFEAIRIFGGQLVGTDAPSLGIVVAGAAFHALNGIAFGASFVLVVRRPGVLSGIGWALALETFQLTLYPGWLDIRAYQEFAQVSAASHLAYGTVLGLMGRNRIAWRIPGMTAGGSC